MMWETLLGLLAERLPELRLRLGEHILLTTVSTGTAVILGIPLGILAYRKNWLRGPLLAVIGVLQTIPSLAMLAILLVLLGRIGAVPAVMALVLYALLPIVRNTLTGLENVTSEYKQAAVGIGMTDRQKLLWVELPLAEPVILAGVRTAAVVGVGIATLSAFIGAGGLGQFINRGLALSNTNLILLGAIPAAFLAIAIDLTIAAYQWARVPRTSLRRTRKDYALRFLCILLPFVLLAGGLWEYQTGRSENNRTGTSGRPTLRIGSKNFTEQIILGEVLAQLVENQLGVRVQRRFNLGGTMICHEALARGEIDVYVEYTGTALTAILDSEHLTGEVDPATWIRQEYEDRFNCRWFGSLGFDNTYAIAVRESDSVANDWETISDLVGMSNDLRAGFTAEFSERPDGYPGLTQAYDLTFGHVADLDPSILYDAVARKEVDVICAFATDGRIEGFDLIVLRDDREFFPPYEAAPVAREEILRDIPELEGLLKSLEGRIDAKTMRELNHRADILNEDPANVAAQFLKALGFVEKASPRYDFPGESEDDHRERN